MIVNGMQRRNFMKTAAALGAALRIGAEQREEATSLPAGSLIDVGGIKVGHFTETRRPTGCTVILFDQPAVAGVDVRGAAPGTRETDLLNPVNTVQTVNAIVLSGGSAFGLDAATGVVRYLDERGIGFRAGRANVPIVPAAILFDLSVGDFKIRPTAESGYAACKAATAANVEEGNVGAGAGATVGKLFGNESAMKSGLGTASIKVGDTDLIVAALVAVNAVGDIRDYETGKILAGARSPDGKGFIDSIARIIQGTKARTELGAHSNIGIVATNATLTKTQATKIAQMAHDGFARTINPVHTAYDGDTIFAAATARSKTPADVTTIGAIGAVAMARAVNRAVWAAAGIPGYPAARDLERA